MIWVILQLLTAPVPPPPAPTLSVVVPSRVDEVQWSVYPSNWVSLGVSNRLQVVTPLGETNYFLVTNYCKVDVPRDGRTFYRVFPVFDGVEGTNASNTVGNPPKTVGKVIGQRDGKDIGVLEVWTNPPAAPIATYRLRVELTEDYSP